MLRVALSITKFKRTICNVMNDERFEFLKKLHIDKIKLFSIGMADLIHCKELSLTDLAEWK